MHVCMYMESTISKTISQKMTAPPDFHPPPFQGLKCYTVLVHVVWVILLKIASGTRLVHLKHKSDFKYQHTMDCGQPFPVKLVKLHICSLQQPHSLQATELSIHCFFERAFSSFTLMTQIKHKCICLEKCMLCCLILLIYTDLF